MNANVLLLNIQEDNTAQMLIEVLKMNPCMRIPAREMFTVVTKVLAEHKRIRTCTTVLETNLPTRRNPLTGWNGAMLHEEASMHAERNGLMVEQHVAISQWPTGDVTNDRSGQRHAGIYLIQPTTVHNALVPLAL